MYKNKENTNLDILKKLQKEKKKKEDKHTKDEFSMLEEDYLRYSQKKKLKK